MIHVLRMRVACTVLATCALVACSGGSGAIPSGPSGTQSVNGASGETGLPMSGAVRSQSGGMTLSSGSGPSVQFTTYTLPNDTNSADGIAIDHSGAIWTDGHPPLPNNSAGIPALFEYQGTSYHQFNANDSYQSGAQFYGSAGKLAIASSGTIFDAMLMGSTNSTAMSNLFFYLAPRSTTFTAGSPVQPGAALSSSFGQVITGPDGNVWFTAPAAEDVSNNPIPGVFGKVSTSGITTYALPNGASPFGLTVGPDHDLWVSVSTGSSDAFERYSTDGTLLAPVPTTYQANQSITGLDGNLWSLAGAGTRSLDVERTTPTGATTTYALTDIDGFDSITNGSDGALWFTASLKSQPLIGRITTSGSIALYTFPASLGVTTDGQIIGAGQGCAAGTLWVATGIGPVKLTISSS